jgi:hypothetical protein
MGPVILITGCSEGGIGYTMSASSLFADKNSEIISA